MPNLTQSQVLDALAENDFNLHLTAEKLKSSTAQLLTQLTQEAESNIIGHMRVRMVLETYTLWRNNLDIYATALVNAEPKDILRAFMQLTQAMSDVTKSTGSVTNNVNMAQVAFNQLPPDIRNKVIQFMPDELPSASANLAPSVQSAKERIIDQLNKEGAA